MRSECGIVDRKRLENLVQNLLFDSDGRIILFHRNGETIEECFVLDVRVSESTIIRSLALRVRSGKDRETGSRSDPLTDLLQVKRFSFEDRLKTHHQRTTEVHFVEAENRTRLGSNGHGSVYPYGFTIDQTESTHKVVFVRLLRDVDANPRTRVLGTNLLDHRGLTVSGKSSDVGSAEHTRLDDGIDIGEISPFDERLLAGRNACFGSIHSSNRRSGNHVHGSRNRCRSGNDWGNLLRRGSRAWCWRRGQIVPSQFREVEESSTCLAVRILDDPRWSVVRSESLSDFDQIGTRNGRSQTSGHACGNEGGLFRSQVLGSCSGGSFSRDRFPHVLIIPERRRKSTHTHDIRRNWWTFFAPERKSLLLLDLGG